MASQLDICNEALALLGEMPIDDINDVDDPKAVKAKVFWASTVDELLELHAWGFATVRAELEQDVTAPVYGFSYAYPIPADCLRVLVATVNESELDSDDMTQTAYRVEYGKILSDEATLYLKYIARIGEPGRFSTLFAAALVARLAAKLAGAFTKSGATIQAMMQLSEFRLSEARRMDNLQGGMTVLSRSSWKQARL